MQQTYFAGLSLTWESYDLRTCQRQRRCRSPSLLQGAFPWDQRSTVRSILHESWVFSLEVLGAAISFAPLIHQGRGAGKMYERGRLGCMLPIIPQTGLPMGFYLRKKETGHAGGRAVLCWARIWLCWAHWAGLGADLALLSVGWGRAGRAAWGLALVGGRGVWPWVRWVGLGVGFGSGGRAGPLFSTLDSTAIVLIKRL